jgi:hypothetical protein
METSFELLISYSAANAHSVKSKMMATKCKLLRTNITSGH